MPSWMRPRRSATDCRAALVRAGRIGLARCANSAAAEGTFGTLSQARVPKISTRLASPSPRAQARGLNSTKQRFLAPLGMTQSHGNRLFQHPHHTPHPARQSNFKGFFGTLGMYQSDRRHDRVYHRVPGAIARPSASPSHFSSRWISTSIAQRFGRDP